MSPKTLSVIVVGGGIGGLTSAISLRRAGHQVTIYEKVPFKQEGGFGVAISTSGNRVLRQLGLDFEKAKMRDYLGIDFINAQTLAQTGPTARFSDLEVPYGERTKTAYRPDLYKALLGLAISEGGDGTPVQIVNATIARMDAEVGSITLQDGEVIYGDLLVAADGVHSNAVQHIFSPRAPPPLEYPGDAVYRFTLPTRRILEDAETRSLLEAGPGIGSYWLSPTGDRWLMRYGCSHDGIQNFGLYVKRPQEEDSRHHQALRRTVDKATLQQEINGFHPKLLKLVDTSSDVLPLWRLATREPLSKLHHGRMVVIGDAAHPVLNHRGLGANTAIEDAGTLGGLFEDFPEGENTRSAITKRLELFSKLRVPRVAVVKYHSDNAPRSGVILSREQKDKIRSLSSAADELPGNPVEMTRWKSAYDAYDEAHKAVKGLKTLDADTLRAY